MQKIIKKLALILPEAVTLCRAAELSIYQTIISGLRLPPLGSHRCRSGQLLSIFEAVPPISPTVIVDLSAKETHVEKSNEEELVCHV